MFILSTSSLSGYGLHRIFDFAKKSGYVGLDISLSTENYDTTNPQYIQSLVDMYSLPVHSITAYERRLDRKIVDATLDLADALHVNLVGFYAPHRTDRDKTWYTEYLPIAVAKYPHIRIMCINAPPKTFLLVISEYGDARPEIIKKITGHTALCISNVEPESGVDLLRTYTLLGNTIGQVYLSDKTAEKDMLFPGNGDMPLESLLIKLREAGYTGPMSLQIQPKEL
jgi:sugar phosphate isomerase/epimerase